MASLNKKIRVSQSDNPRFDSSKPEAVGNPPYVYRVESAVNTLDFPIGKYLSQSEVQREIDNGRVMVEIVKVK